MNQKQTQTLALTPTLLQAIRVLGMTLVELDAFLEDEIENNPVIEFDWAAYLDDRSETDADLARTVRTFAEDGSDDEDAEPSEERAVTLADYLVEQLSTSDVAQALPNPEVAAAVALYLIESLDENGFQTQTPEEVARALCVQPEDVGRVLEVLRGFDPPGVGARDIADCLILQLDRGGEKAPTLRKIIRECLAEVAAGRIAAVAKKAGLRKEDAEAAVARIRRLDPKPGRGFAGAEKTQYIVPDIIVEKSEDGDGFEIRMGRAAVPSLTVNPYYRQVLKSSGRDSEEHQFLTERLNAAVALIKSLEQREQTIYNVTNAVLREQRLFLEKGREHLKPLTLKKVATELGIHESTVSRTIRGKYVQTPRGVFELKYFFASGVAGSGGGGDLTTEAVRQRIRDMIAEEPAGAPLSDEQIAQRLSQEGMKVSRRTVAKYRDEAGIPSSQARRAR
ncbi:MAG: RNA polymerase factor sigma-54 [Clostridiales Family XIII bacterium]|nr:RNA polymerase factor sigma-54 [Clostridiales Family XIII bacterium]